MTEFVRNVLIVDDEEPILDSMENLLMANLNIFTTTDPNEVLSIMNNRPFAVVMVDYKMPKMDGIQLLTKIREQYPQTRRILMSGKLDVDIALESLNEAKTHLILKKPIEIQKVEKILLDHTEKYNSKLVELSKIEEMQIMINQLPEVTALQTNHLLELLFHISETSQIPNFSNYFVKALEGLKSLGFLNTEVYLENPNVTVFNHILLYLSDIEVIANQYDQKILALYVLILRAYLHLYNGDFDEAKIQYAAVEALYHWLKDTNLNPILREIITDYPKEVENQILKLSPTLPLLEIQIKKLFSIEMGDLVGFSEGLFEYYEFQKPQIIYFVIVRDELPLYEKKAKNINFDATLITGFVVALSHFLQEVASGTGDIDAISHRNGVILFHKQNDINYVLFSSVDDVSHRIALRQIAFETEAIINEIPRSYLASDNEIEQINDKVISLLGEF